MAANQPTVKNLAELYDLAPLDWEDVARSLRMSDTQAPGTGGPDHHTFWLATTDADGGPHMTAVGAMWVDGKYYFTGGEDTRKVRNVERNPRCSLGAAVHGYDVAIEGRAVRVTDEVVLRKLADVFAAGGWAPEVREGGYTHEYSAPSAGPPPWFLYEMTPEHVYAVATKEPGGATRWTF
jgi:nitroimidazol reductase NimA-like FMN-containing flavoprotein (pyridoxamine 5'-phosphate oxidase superfamily)